MSYKPGRDDILCLILFMPDVIRFFAPVHPLFSEQGVASALV